ncbi:MAG: phosphotransferase [Anaerolineales bacterium]|nr:phosphotransferase [Anaerolineales bacterium]MCB8954674.1 phosphotransferase [Ardenticatenales bacterium]
MRRPETLILPAFTPRLPPSPEPAPAPPLPEADRRETDVYGRELTHTDLLLGAGTDNLLLRRIAAQYKIGPIRGFSYPAVVTTTSRKAIIHTTDGAYFLKEKPDYCADPLSITLATGFQHFLAERLPFVPRIIRTRDNGFFVPANGRKYVLTVFQPGRMFRGADADIEMAAAALAWMHNAAAEFAIPETYPRKSSYDETRFFWQRAYDLAGSARALDKEPAMMGLRAFMEQAGDKASPDAGIRHLITHGDYSPLNLVFSATGVAAVNDFDNCDHHPRVRDLAEAMLTFSDGVSYAGNTSNLRRPIATRYDREKARLFYHTYQAHTRFPLSDAEKRLVTGEMIFIWIELMCLGLVRGDFNYHDVFNSLSMGKSITTMTPQITDAVW